MTRSPNYPLAPLRDHRDHRVDEAAASLAAAVRARESAEARESAAKAAHAAALARINEAKRRENERFSRGELRVGDIEQSHVWDERLRQEIAVLVEAHHHTVRSLENARCVEATARAALAQKKVELDVVVNDQDRFEERARDRSQVAEEDAADDAFVAVNVEDKQEEP
jgi:hypothetical protein